MWRAEWRAEGEATLWVGAASVVCSLPGQAGVVSQPIMGQDLAAFRAALHALGTQGGAGSARAPRGGTVRLRVWVASRWLGLLALPWSTDLRRPETAQAYAAGQLRAAGFTLDPGDVIRVDDAPYQALRTVALYRAPLLDALNSCAQALGMTIEAVLPLMAIAPALLPRPRRPAGEVVAMAEGGDLELILGRAGHWTPLGASTAVEDPGRPEGELARLWQRAQLRDASLAALQPQVLALEPGASLSELRRLPLQQAHPLNAVSPGHALRGWRLAAVCAGMAIAGYGVFQAASATAHWQERQAARLVEPTKPPLARKASRSREEQARIAAVNAAILELNLPVATLLQATQPPRDVRVGLLGVEVVPGRLTSDQAVTDAVFRLTAQAQSGADMARYVAMLAGRRPFTSAFLVSHEVNEGDPARPYRFTVEATWHD